MPRYTCILIFIPLNRLSFWPLRYIQRFLSLVDFWEVEFSIKPSKIKDSQVSSSWHKGNKMQITEEKKWKMNRKQFANDWYSCGSNSITKYPSVPFEVLYATNYWNYVIEVYQSPLTLEGCLEWHQRGILNLTTHKVPFWNTMPLVAVEIFFLSKLKSRFHSKIQYGSNYS